MNAIAKHPYAEAAERALKKQGGFFILADIMEGVKTGEFQSHANGDSWAITRIARYPRKTALEIVFMIGEAEELKALEEEVVKFARDHGATIGYAIGRKGYTDKAFPGWKMVAALFIKDLTHG